MKAKNLSTLGTTAFFLLLARCSSPDAFHLASDGGSDGEVADAENGADAEYDLDVSTDEPSPVDAAEGGDGFDGYSPPPAPYRRIFITSEVYATTFGSLAAGDALCQTAAQKVSLGGVWKAWLSTTVTSAAARLEHATVPYVLVDTTTVVAPNWAGLTSGTLEHAIDHDESGALVTVNTPYAFSGYAMTGTLADGTTGTTTTCGPGGCTCGDWTTTTLVTVLDGTVQYTDGNWTVAGKGGYCGISFALYCVEQA